VGVEVVSGQRALEENGREVQLCWADVWESLVEEAAWDQPWSVDLLTWFIVFIDGCCYPFFILVNCVADT